MFPVLSTHPPLSRNLQRERRVFGERQYLLIDVGDGGIGSDDRLFIRGALVHGQNARVDDEAQCRVFLWQFKCKHLCVVIYIRHFRKLPRKSAF